MKWLRGASGDQPADDGGGDAVDDASDWAREALYSLPASWVRVDAGMVVRDASPAALKMFGAGALPTTLIAFTRSARIEAHAREALAGGRGPWDVEGGIAQPSLRIHGAALADGTVLLYFDDVSEVLRLEAVRADFVANLAHELRTPVASLSLAAETLAGGLRPEEQERFVTRIADETRYIEGLLRTVSELAFLDGSVKLQVSRFRLAEAVRDSWRRVVDLQGAAELASAVAPELELSADRIRVSEILQNLLENAHRYSPPGTPVEVGATEETGQVTVWVADNGPGIPPADLPRVFERFYKVDRARTRRGDGSGLGLAICKHLVTAHGGGIWAEPGETGGTRVSFTIPSGT